MRPRSLHTLLITALLFGLLSAVDLSAQWVRIASFNGTFYNEVYFATSQLGFICTQTGTIHRTTDGGDSWATVTLPNASVSSNRDVAFPSSSVGFISGEDGIWKTTNSGVSWSNVTPAGVTGISSSSCWFRSTSVGVWGYGSCFDTIVTFWRTTDGGTSWTSVTDTASAADVAVGGITYQSGKFYVAGGSGKFWSSTNDGATWTVSNTGSAGWQEDLVERQGQLLIASANGSSCSMTGGGKILRSNDGGTSWTINAFPNVVMWGVSMYTASNGIAVGDRGAAFRTLDGGVTWGAHDCGLDPVSRLDDVFMVDGTNGFAVGDGVYRYRPDTFTVLRDTIDFGDVLVGTRSTPIDAEILSLGTAGTITLRQIAGTDAPAFGSTANLSATQSIVGCLKALTPLHFQPSRSGTHTAKFSATLLGKSQKLEIVLRGNGVRPRLNVDARLSFDSLLCPTVREDSLLLRNFGDYPLVIDSVAITNNRGSLEILSPDLPMTILPLTYRALHLRARTAGIGRMSGRLLLYTNDPDYSDSARTIFWTLERSMSGFEPTPDTIVLEPRAFGETSAACLQLVNQSGQRVEVTGLRPIIDIPEVNARLPGGSIAGTGERLDICFSATANDTVTRYETYFVITEPCTNQRTITICYRADEDVVILPDSISLNGPCGTMLSSSFFIRNIGPHPIDFDTIRSGASDTTLTAATDRLLPTTLDPGDSIEVSVFWTSVDSENGTGLLMIKRGSTTDTVVVSAEFIGPRFSAITPTDTIRICLGDTLRFPAEVTNSGNAGGTIRFERSPSDPALYRIEHPDLSVAAGEKSMVEVSVLNLTEGIHKIHLLYRGACQEPDSVGVVVEAIGHSIAVTPRQIDFGVLVPGDPPPTRTVLVRNLSGERIEQIGIIHHDSLSVQSGGVSPPFMLNGDSLTISVSPLTTEPGEYLDSIWIDDPGGCGDPIPVVVKWSIPGNGARLAGEGRAQSDRCDSIPEASFTLLAPASESVVVSSIRLSDGRSIEIPGVDTLDGYHLGPGSSVEFILSLRVDAPADVYDTLSIVLDNGDTLRTPLYFSWRRPEVGWSQNGGSGSTLVLRRLRDSCESDTLTFSARNRGTAPDLVRVEIVGGGYELTGESRRSIAPGDTIDFTFHSKNPGVADTTKVVLESIACMTRDTIVLIREMLPPLLVENQTIDLGTLCLEESQEIEVVVPVNLFGHSSPNDVITSIRRVDPSGTTVDLPFDISPDQASLLVRVPITPGMVAPSLILETDLPCGTPFSIRLKYEWIDCTPPRVTLSIPRLMGSWGETHRIPIYLDAPTEASIENLTLVVAVNPLFLDLEEVEPGDAWDLVDRSLLSGEGRAFINLRASGSRLTERSVVAYVNGSILRGPITGTEIRFDTTVTPGRVRPQWIHGSLGLHDFCDAEGRLLDATGVVAIKSIGQNPGHPPLRITYEIPFVEDHSITLYDQLGREVYQIRHRQMPAGERVEEIDDSSISSGAYTLVIEAGRQRLVRRIVLW